MQFAVAVMPDVLRWRTKRAPRAGDSLVARPVFLQALADYRKSRGSRSNPDANSSLRITFGNVTGYTKTDRAKPLVHHARAGRAEGDRRRAVRCAADRTRCDPREELRRPRRPRLGTCRFNFLSDLDITGGNSGSPVMDAQGRLVGLAFDGNWESVSSNWVFDPAMTRMIAVDQRYMRWIMQEVYPARPAAAGAQRTRAQVIEAPMGRPAQSPAFSLCDAKASGVGKV